MSQRRSRTGKVERKTKETEIAVSVDLDGSGRSEISTGIWAEDSTNLEGQVLMEPPVYIGNGCTLQPDARLTGPVVMGEGCTIGAGAVLNDVLVWSGTQVAPGAELSGGIAGIDSLAEGPVA